MADKSPLFNPPQDHVPMNDPAIIRVPMDYMPWAARKSQNAKAWNQMGQSGDADGTGNVKNLANGK